MSETRKDKDVGRGRHQEITLEVGVGVYAFNPNDQKTETGRFLSLRSAWSAEQVSGGQGYTEKPSLEKEIETKKERRKKEKK